MLPTSSLSFVAVLAAVTVATVPMRHSPVHDSQSGVGAKYGARDPHACPDRGVAPRGAISAAQAAAYVTCTQEQEVGESLFLVDNVRIEVGGGRPYQHVQDSADDIDPRKPVYPIRGSFTKYQCAAVYTPKQMAGFGYANNRGKNCAASDYANGTGRCYATTFGDWHCYLQTARSTVSRARDGIAPPQ